MQTLTQNPLEFRQVHDTEYRIYQNGQNVGAIAFNITAMRWEYSPYGQPVRAVGTLEHPDGPNGKLYLKWPKVPVRRSAVAA